MANGGTEVARAYVTIIPRSDGSSDKVVHSVVDPLGKSGGDAGDKAGKEFSTRFQGHVTKAAAVIGSIGLAKGVKDFVGSSVEAGKTFDASMSQVAATMGKTMEEMGSEVGAVDTAYGHFEGTLSDFARYMGANTAFSANEAADALNYMALAGYDAQTSMDMLPNVLNLAAAGSIDLAYASDMVTDASSALGLDIGETAELVDKMAQTASKSNTSVAQLGDAILTVGGTAANLKGGTTELSAALGILANNGIKGAEGGTHLRNMLLSLQSPTDDAAKALEDLGVHVFDENQQLNSLGDIFGELNGQLSQMSDQEKVNVLSSLFNKTDLAAAQAMLAGTANSVEDLKIGLRAMGVAGEDAALTSFTLEGGFDELAAAAAGGADASSLAKQMIEDYGLSAENAATVSEQLAGVVSGEANDFERLSGFIDDSAGAAQKMGDTQLDNLEGDITKFNSALGEAQLSLSESLTPALRDLVQYGTDGLGTLTEYFKSDSFKEFASTTAHGIADGLSAIGGAIEFLVKNADVAIPAVTVLGGGFLLFNGAASVAEGIAAISAVLPAVGAGGGVAAGGLTATAAGEAEVAAASAAAGPSLLEVGGAVLMIGGGVALAAGGIWLLADAAIRLSESGGDAVPIIAGLGAGIVALGAAAVLGGSLMTAGAVGIVAFGVAVLAVGAGIGVASAGLSLLAGQLPAISEYGAGAAGSLAAMGGGAMALGGGALFAGVGLVTLGAGLAVAGVGLLAATPAMAAAAGGAGLLSAALGAMSGPIHDIGDSSQRFGAGLVDAGGGMAAIAENAPGAAMAVIDLAGKLGDAASASESAKARITDALDIPDKTIRVNFEMGPLPHFNINGEFDMGAGTVPTIDVSWWEKGGVFTRPAIIGVGEGREPEGVLPLSAIESMVDGGERRAVNVNVNLNYEAGDDANALARGVARRVGAILSMEG